MNKKIELTYDKHFRTAYLKIDGQEFLGSDVYLSIRNPQERSYQVKGVVGFGGMGYSGYISTCKLVQGLNKLGVNITARKLRDLFKSI